MSYLDPPRFSFAGTFQATPSTINNSTENYPAGVKYNNDPASPQNPTSVWWNPGGWAFFEVLSGTVNGACLDLGANITSGDAIIGANVVSIPAGTVQPYHQGRLVDLDPDQQGRSLVVGMQLQIQTGDGASVTGVVAPMTIIDLWGRVQGGNGGSINWAGCMYQSVMQNVTWNGIESTSSAVLKALHAASPNTLSIKFNVDAYNGLGPQYPGFSTGRIAGTIGPYGELAPGVPEPMHVLAQRRMYGSLPGGTAPAVSLGYPPSNGPSPLNPAPFQVKNGWLTIDLGNSIPTTLASSGLAGPFAELGAVVPIISPPEPPSVVPPPGGWPPAVALPALFSTAADFAASYQAFAGIYDVPLGGASADGVTVGLQIAPPSSQSVLTAEQVKMVKAGLDVAPAAMSQAAGTPLIALAENPGGQFASLDFNALRLAYGAPAWSPAALTGTEVTGDAAVPFYATVFGQPAAYQTFNVQTALNQYQFPTTPNYISNDPASAITPAPSGWTPPPGGTMPNVATIATDANGVGAFQVTANALTAAAVDPVQNGRRAALGSQLYLYAHDWNMDTTGQPITVLVFVSTPGPSQPTWADDVSPIFQQYATLYPGMRQVLDLGDYGTVVGNLPAFKTVMNLPTSDPSHMPVTRDLSPANLAMINAWFANPQK
jgi:hypothetical protein